MRTCDICKKELDFDNECDIHEGICCTCYEDIRREEDLEPE